jgi:hypothetical protein
MTSGVNGPPHSVAKTKALSAIAAATRAALGPRRRAADAGQLIRLIGLWLLGQRRVQRRFDAVGRSLR